MQIQEHLFLWRQAREDINLLQTHREAGCISSGTLVLRLVPQLLLFCLSVHSQKWGCDETLGTESVSGNVRQPPSVITSWLWDHVM